MGSIKDSYGQISTPRTDFINDYKSPSVTKSSDNTSMQFFAKRQAAPSDTIGIDKAFACGTFSDFTWVVKPSGETGAWTFKLNDDCSVWSEPDVQPDNNDEAKEEETGAKALVASSVAAAALMATLF